MGVADIGKCFHSLGTSVTTFLVLAKCFVTRGLSELQGSSGYPFSSQAVRLGSEARSTFTQSRIEQSILPSDHEPHGDNGYHNNGGGFL